MPGSRFKVLAPVDMVLHAIVHLFYGGEMDDALRELVDIDDLLRHFAATEPGFWEQFWPRVEALDLAAAGVLRAALCAADARNAGARVCDERVKAGAPPAPVLRDDGWLVPQALFPRPFDGPSDAAEHWRAVLATCGRTG